jgi:hypothetical protein
MSLLGAFMHTNDSWTNFCDEYGMNICQGPFKLMSQFDSPKQLPEGNNSFMLEKRTSAFEFVISFMAATFLKNVS